MKKTEIETLARKALTYGNPYIDRATRFYIGDAEMFLYGDRHYTREEIDNAYVETAKKDITSGYNDRIVGYYDKWYRYNHADEGRAYDFGVRKAAESSKCVEEMIIIPA